MVAWIVRLNLPVAASDFFFCEMTAQAAARLPAFRVADFTNGTAQRTARRGVDATPQPPLPAGEEKARTRQSIRLRCELRDPTRRDRRELRRIHRMIGACAPKPRGKMPLRAGDSLGAVLLECAFQKLTVSSVAAGSAGKRNPRAIAWRKGSAGPHRASSGRRSSRIP